MKKLLKLLGVSLLSMSLFVSAVACGNDPKPTATEDKTYVFASDTAYRPFEFQDEKGEYVGFDIDLIAAIAEASGFKYEIRSMNFDGVLGGVQSGLVDGAISAITITDERKQKMDFSDPYFDANQSIAVKKDNNDIAKEEDLKGKKIGVQLGTTGALLAEEIAGVENVKHFNNIVEAFLELENGGVVAVMNDIPVTADYIQSGDKDIKVAFEIPTGETYGIAVKKGNAELLEKINSGLKTIKENGKYDEIYQKWFGTN